MFTTYLVLIVIRYCNCPVFVSESCIFAPVACICFHNSHRRVYRVQRFDHHRGGHSAHPDHDTALLQVRSDRRDQHLRVDHLHTHCGVCSSGDICSCIFYKFVESFFESVWCHLNRHWHFDLDLVHCVPLRCHGTRTKRGEFISLM